MLVAVSVFWVNPGSTDGDEVVLQGFGSMPSDSKFRHRLPVLCQLGEPTAFRGPNFQQRPTRRAKMRKCYGMLGAL